VVGSSLIFSGIVLPDKPKTFLGVLGSFPRGNAVAAGAELWTMLPVVSGGLAVRPPGRFHVETARIKIFSLALRAFPRGNDISDDYAMYYLWKSFLMEYLANVPHGRLTQRGATAGSKAAPLLILVGCRNTNSILLKTAMHNPCRFAREAPARFRHTRQSADAAQPSGPLVSLASIFARSIL
jgi:hypothetical protein